MFVPASTNQHHLVLLNRSLLLQVNEQYHLGVFLISIFRWVFMVLSNYI